MRSFNYTWSLVSIPVFLTTYLCVVSPTLLSSSVRARLQCRTEQSRTMLAVCLLSCLLSSLVHTQPDSPSRPQVDPEQEMTILETCAGVADGTRCTKRCIHWTCDPKYARCYQGHCKRAGHHPCNTGSPSHPCCCGSCDKLMVNINLLVTRRISSEIQDMAQYFLSVEFDK